MPYISGSTQEVRAYFLDNGALLMKQLRIYLVEMPCIESVVMRVWAG